MVPLSFSARCRCGRSFRQRSALLVDLGVNLGDDVLNVLLCLRHEFAWLLGNFISATHRGIEQRFQGRAKLRHKFRRQNGGGPQDDPGQQGGFKNRDSNADNPYC